MRVVALVATLLSVGSSAYAAVAKTCPSSNICYSLNIPETTANSGSGDIYFQLSAPTSYQWVALGQGSQMAGANMFVMYTSADGKNVTLSPRLGTGEVMPQHDMSTQVEVLSGSGVSNGVMTANVKCSNCDSWKGGEMDLTSSSASWIYAWKSGSALDSDSLSENIVQHDEAEAFSWDMADAQGGNDDNPLRSAASSGSVPSTCTPIASSTLASPSGSNCPTAWPSQYSTSWPTARPTGAASCFPSGYAGRPGGHGHGQGPWPRDAPWTPNAENRKRDNSCPAGYKSSSAASDDDGYQSYPGYEHYHHIIIAHAVLACFAFVFLFPIGGILIRIGNFSGCLWVHAGIQMFAYLIYIIAFGMGVYLATSFHKINSAHPIIGIALFMILLGQPIFGWLHHRLFKKYGHRTFWSYMHLWHGRVAVVLGMINGGLGLQFAKPTPRAAYIAYGVVAGVIGVAYIASIIVGERRRKTKAPPSYDRSQKTHQLSNVGSSASSADKMPIQGYHSRRPPAYERV